MAEDSAFCIFEYFESIRVALFLSGFTVGSFLFSMKSLIISTMKSSCYDSKRHKSAVRQRRKLGESIGYYSSLRNFSILLTASIAVSVFSGLAQITLGFLREEWAVYLCLGAALLSWILLAIVLGLVSSNWLKVLEYAEADAMKEEIDFQKEAGTKEERS